MTRVVLIGDIRIYVDALFRALRHVEVLEVVGVACGAEEGWLLVQQHEPLVAVVDSTMAGSAEIVRRLGQFGTTRCVLVGVEEDEDRLMDCAQAGPFAVVTCSRTIEDLVDCIQSTARGKVEINFSPDMGGKLFQKMTQCLQGQPTSTILALTPRELDILSLIERGRSNKEIAHELTIQTATVKNHVHNILCKLGVGGRMQAAEMYRRSNHFRATVQRHQANGSDPDLLAV